MVGDAGVAAPVPSLLGQEQVVIQDRRERPALAREVDNDDAVVDLAGGAAVLALDAGLARPFSNATAMVIETCRRHDVQDVVIAFSASSATATTQSVAMRSNLDMASWDWGSQVNTRISTAGISWRSCSTCSSVYRRPSSNSRLSRGIPLSLLIPVIVT